MAKNALNIKDNCKKKRLANMELLRMIAMMMVIMLHYLGKGGLLGSLQEKQDACGYVAWGLEALSIVAVNVYMLISGYFLVESRFKISRVLGLIMQALFYSLLVPVCLVLFGVLSPGEITVYQLLYYVFPVQMEHYWFLTAYVLMYLVSPLLGVAVRNISRKQHQLLLACLLAVLSVGKSVLPVHLEMDRYGYDALWFICVYLVAAYIRLYGIPFFKNGKISACLYVLACGAIFGITMAVHGVYLKTGALEYFLSAAYDYNHIVNLFAAVALFYAFTFVHIPEGKLSSAICKLSPYTFGVYLLHEQYEIRYLWPRWLGAGTASNPAVMVLLAVLAVLIVFALGILVDLLRSLLFQLISSVLKKTVIGKGLERMDEVFALQDHKEE